MGVTVTIIHFSQIAVTAALIPSAVIHFSSFHSVLPIGSLCYLGVTVLNTLHCHLVRHILSFGRGQEGARLEMKIVVI